MDAEEQTVLGVPSEGCANYCFRVGHGHVGHTGVSGWRRADPASVSFRTLEVQQEHCHPQGA